MNLENLVNLSPDEEDNCKEVEHDQGGDKDRRLRSIIPRTLPPPSLWRHTKNWDFQILSDIKYLCMA